MGVFQEPVKPAMKIKALNAALKRCSTPKPEFFRSLLGLGSLPASGFPVDGGEVAAFQHVVCVRLFADVVQNSVRLGVVVGSLGLIAAEAKRLAQQIVALGERRLQAQLLTGSQAVLELLAGARIFFSLG